MAESSKQTQAWKSFTEEQYRQAIAEFVHFSTKTINSNAKATGIRLDASQAKRSRYLCASSVLASGTLLPLDYLTNSGPAATIARQVDWVLSDNLPDKVDPKEVALIRECYNAACHAPFVAHTDKVSPRVRQLFLPCQDHHYMVITPITSSGLTAAVQERTRINQEHWRKAKEQKKTEPSQANIRRLRTAQMGFGGDNAQNIGRLASKKQLQHPLFFGAPSHHQSVRAQYFAAHQGVRPLLHPSIMAEMRDTLLPLQQHNDGELPTTLKTREKVDQLIDRLVSSLLQRALHTQKQALEVLAQIHAATELDEPLSNPWQHLPDYQQGLMDVSLRDRAWRQSLTTQLLKLIDHYTYPDELSKGHLSFDKTWLIRIEKRIEAQLL